MSIFFNNCVHHVVMTQNIVHKEPISRLRLVCISCHKSWVPERLVFKLRDNGFKNTNLLIYSASGMETLYAYKIK